MIVRVDESRHFVLDLLITPPPFVQSEVELDSKRTLRVTPRTTQRQSPSTRTVSYREGYLGSVVDRQGEAVIEADAVSGELEPSSSLISRAFCEREDSTVFENMRFVERAEHQSVGDVNLRLESSGVDGPREGRSFMNDLSQKSKSQSSTER